MNRKNVNIVLFLFFSLSVLVSNAQAKYGMRFGAVWSYGNQEQASEFVTYGSSIVSFTAGVFADLEIDRSLLVNVGLHYEERMVQYEGSVPTGVFGIFTTFSGEDRFKYITLPVFLEYSPINRIGISTGPQLGVLLDVKSEVLGFGSFNTNEFANDIDLSWGVGLEFQGTKSSIGARYHLGLLDLNDPPVEGSSYQINTLQVYLAATLN